MIKTRLLPLIAIISISASTNAIAASNAYVTDSYGEIVKDAYGSCVRSSSWTPETADASCETPKTEKASSTKTVAESTTAENKPAPTLLPPVKEDIDGSDQVAYVVDSQNRIVRDNYGYCVRTIHWSKDTAMAKCEGWAEPKPPVVAKPAPVVVPEPKPVYVQKIVDTAPVEFRGFFDFDKAILKDAAKTKLNDYSDYLSHNPKTEVKVTGHTDSTGPAEYNQKLSEKRANSVKTYLESKGIEADRIHATGMGEENPTASNKTREGRAENRRVEMEIIK